MDLSQSFPLKRLSEEELTDLADLQPECQNLKCCEFGKFNNCYTHAHCLCETFEIWYSYERVRRVPKDL